MAARKAPAAKAEEPAKPQARTVTATLVTVKFEDGSIHYLSSGDPLPAETSQESIDNLDSLGFLSADK